MPIYNNKIKMEKILKSLSTKVKEKEVLWAITSLILFKAMILKEIITYQEDLINSTKWDNLWSPDGLAALSHLFQLKTHLIKMIPPLLKKEPDILIISLKELPNYHIFTTVNNFKLYYDHNNQISAKYFLNGLHQLLNQS